MGRAMLLLVGLMALGCVPGGLAGPPYFTTPNCATGDRKAPRIERVGEFKNGNYGGSGVEVLAYSNYKGAAIVAVVESNPNSSGVRILEVTDITLPKEITFIPSPYGYPNSVSFYNNVLAVSCDGVPTTGAGWVLLYTLDVSVDRAAGTQTVTLVDTKAIELKSGSVDCAMPDMLTWNEKGDKIYTACEGEPSTQGTEKVSNNWLTGSRPDVGVNPAGAIGVVSVAWAPGPNGVEAAAATKIISIQEYLNRLTDTQYSNLLKAGLLIDARIAKTKAIAANDIEPEYIALSDDGRTLYCTLQENNAILVVDLAAEEVRAIWPLGLKDWGRYKLDASDRDDGTAASARINIKNWPSLRGLYQPDTIMYKKIRGRGYLFISNEGDAKEEKVRVGTSAFSPNLLANPLPGSPNWASLRADNQLGRLNINPSCGLRDTADLSKPFNPMAGYDYLCTYGGRSFAILDAETGAMIYDSGDDFERILSQQVPACFNCDRDANTLDGRSDDSGPEPEALEVMELNGRFFALIGLERQSGFMIYDVTNPNNPTFVQWWVYRDFNKDLSFDKGNAAIMGDMAPEMIKFVPGHKSHTNRPLLLVTNEYSASVTLHTVLPCGEPLETTV